MDSMGLRTTANTGTSKLAMWRPTMPPSMPTLISTQREAARLPAMSTVSTIQPAPATGTTLPPLSMTRVMLTILPLQPMTTRLRLISTPVVGTTTAARAMPQVLTPPPPPLLLLSTKPRQSTRPPTPINQASTIPPASICQLMETGMGLLQVSMLTAVSSMGQTNMDQLTQVSTSHPLSMAHQVPTLLLTGMDHPVSMGQPSLQELKSSIESMAPQANTAEWTAIPGKTSTVSTLAPPPVATTQNPKVIQPTPLTANHLPPAMIMVGLEPAAVAAAGREGLAAAAESHGARTKHQTVRRSARGSRGHTNRATVTGLAPSRIQPIKIKAEPHMAITSGEDPSILAWRGPRMEARLAVPLILTGAQLTETEARLAITKALLIITEVLLTAAEALLTAAEALLTTTEPLLTTTEPLLTTTEPLLITTEALLITTEALLITTEPLLTITEAPLTTTEALLITTEPLLTTTEAHLTTEAGEDSIGTKDLLTTVAETHLKTTGEEAPLTTIEAEVHLIVTEAEAHLIITEAESLLEIMMASETTRTEVHLEADQVEALSTTRWVEAHSQAVRAGVLSATQGKEEGPSTLVKAGVKTEGHLAPAEVHSRLVARAEWAVARVKDAAPSLAAQRWALEDEEGEGDSTLPTIRLEERTGVDLRRPLVLSNFSLRMNGLGAASLTRDQGKTGQWAAALAPAWARTWVAAVHLRPQQQPSLLSQPVLPSLKAAARPLCSAVVTVNLLLAVCMGSRSPHRRQSQGLQQAPGQPLETVHWPSLHHPPQPSQATNPNRP